jgi:DNA-binding HxlR family transcriptional regulator
MTLVADIRSADPALSPVGAGLLAALHLGVCRDSRSFSRILGIAHALVLREVTDLSDRALLSIVGRNERTQRTELALTDKGERLLSRVSAQAADDPS